MASVPLRPMIGISGRLSRMPDFSASPITAAVTAALIGETTLPAVEDRLRVWRLATRTIGADRGMASRIVGILGVARTSAVDVRLAIRKWYPRTMPSTTDSQLLAQANASLAEADGILSVGPRAVVGAGETWRDIARRAKDALERAVKAPFSIGQKAAGKIREAAEAGRSKASEADATVRQTLGSVALGAALLAAAPMLLMLLLPVILGESTGLGPRARRAGRTYVDRRLKEYGI